VTNKIAKEERKVRGEKERKKSTLNVILTSMDIF
jgi:hypothetical protein